MEPPAPFDASWELRCGPKNRFRVFYDVDLCIPGGTGSWRLASRIETGSSSAKRSTNHEDCTLADVKARLSAYLDECGIEGPIVITRNGKAVAVLLVPYDDDDLERLLLGRSPRFQAMLNRSRRSIEEGEGLVRGGFLEGCPEASARTKGYRHAARPNGKLTIRRSGLANSAGP